MIASIFFVVSVLVGCLAFLRNLQGLVIYHSAVIAKIPVPKDAISNADMWVWTITVTYNCWYLFVKGL